MRNKIRNASSKSQIAHRKVSTALICFCLTLMSITIIASNTAKAASSSVSFATTESDVTMGDEFTVTMTVSADLNIGAIEIYVSYDDSIVEFISGGSKIGGGNGLLQISDADFEEDSASKKYAMKFKAVDAGLCEIAMSEGPLIYDLDQGAAMSISSNSLSLNIESSKTLSNNNNLESLKVSPGSLEPVFDSAVDTYAIIVPAETKSVVVSGKPEDENAKVTVKGAKELTDGENKIVITVKAQSGKKKEYLINVTREGIESASPSPEPSPSVSPSLDPKEPIQINDFKVVEEEGAIYLENTYRYQLAEVEEDALIPSGYTKTKLILYGVTIPAYSSDDKSDFFLIYALNQDGEPGFYQYDREEKTLQRYNGKLIENPSDVTDTTVFTSDTYRDRVNQLAIIIAVLSAVVALLILLFIRSILKNRGLKDEDID